MNHVIDLPAQPGRGTDALIPVHRICCAGRNYAAHAIEMGHDPDREPPFFFQGMGWAIRKRRQRGYCSVAAACRGQRQ